MRDALRRAFPALLGGATVLAFFGRLADPGAVLAVRDIPQFHLPLRAAFAELAANGLPLWNPMLNGGQPVVSNPNYAAFYPPTWLSLAAGPVFGLNLILLLHAALGFAGAWRLARRLGCGSSAAAFTALAFTGGGAFVSSTGSLTPFCGLAWLPWILRWGDELFDPRAAGRRGRYLIATAAGLALQFLAGEPVIVLTTVLALLCLAVERISLAPRRLAALAAAGLLALSLAAVQLVPSIERVRASARGEGLEGDRFTSWSTAPERLVEWVFPRFFGDPMRGDEDLYFGWRVHEKNYPYLISIYPGLLALVLALAGLVRWPLPRRRAWIAMILLGLFLALGRHNPLYPALAEIAPLLKQIRYPEKFLLLSCSALAFAAGLAWQRLLELRAEGQRQAAEFPAALTILPAAIALILFLALGWRPALAEWFIRQHTLLPLPPARLEVAAGFLRAEALAAVAVGMSAALVLLGARWRRVPFAALILLAPAVLAGDLWLYGRGLTPTVPAADLLEPPALAVGIEPGERVLSDLAFAGPQELTPRSDKEGPDSLWSRIDRLEPYFANLWGLEYVLNEDFDLMLTDWARHAVAILHEEWGRPEPVQRLVGAWSARRMVLSRPVEEILRSRRLGGADQAAWGVANPYVLPRLRFAPQLVFHPDRSSALAAVRREGFRLDRREHWVDPGGSRSHGRVERSARDTRSRDEERSAGRARLRYSASEPTFLVAALTYHEGWQARVDGIATSTYPTAIGQLGVVLPAGEHLLELRYREPALALGLLLTGLGVAACGAYPALSLARRRAAGRQAG